MQSQRIGLIARADNGGLGNLTWEFAEWMKPDKVLIKNLDDPKAGTTNRGGYHPGRFAAASPTKLRVSMGLETSDEDFEWLCADTDVIYTAETSYGYNLWKIARERRVATVLHAMPELFRRGKGITPEPTDVWLPTPWEKDRFARPVVVPVPVASRRFSAHREAVRLRGARDANLVFYHITAPAMLDRNGTEDLLEALECVNQPCKFIFVGEDSTVPIPDRVGVVDIKHVTDRPEDYWDAHPLEADILVLPRRYAGLSMPMQEALAASRPVIAPDLPPQNALPGVIPVPAKKRTTARMAGGVFNVYETDPRTLGTVISRVVREQRGPFFANAYAMTGRFDARFSWASNRPLYESMFEATLSKFHRE